MRREDVGTDEGTEGRWEYNINRWGFKALKLWGEISEEGKGGDRGGEQP